LQGGFVQSVIDATHERPWLWAVLIVVIVLPLVLIVVYCCMSTSKVSSAVVVCHFYHTTRVRIVEYAVAGCSSIVCHMLLLASVGTVL